MSICFHTVGWVIDRAFSLHKSRLVKFKLKADLLQYRLNVQFTGCKIFIISHRISEQC